MAFERARGASTGQNKRSGSESPRDPRLAPVGFQSRVFPGNSPDELPSRILGRVWNAASCRVLPGNYSKIFTCVTPAPEDYEDASHHGADPCPVHEADWLRRDSGGTLEWAAVSQAARRWLTAIIRAKTRKLNDIRLAFLLSELLFQNQRKIRLPITANLMFWKMYVTAR